MPFAGLLSAGLVSGGTSLISSIFGGNAAKKAAQQQARTGQAVGAGLQNMAQQSFDAQQTQLNPYLAAGAQGTNQLAAAYAPGGDLTKQFSFDPSQIANNPNYQFVLQQGLDAVQKSAAAKGGLFSGGTGKALTQFAQGNATQTINDAYSQALNTFQTNRNNQFQGLSTLAGLGQNATQQSQANINERLGANEAAGNAYMGAANAQAAGTVGAANAYTGALSNIGNTAMNLGTLSYVAGLPRSVDPTSVIPRGPAYNPYTYGGTPPFVAPGTASYTGLQQ